MRYEDVPDNNWILYYIDTKEILFYDASVSKVLKEAKKYNDMQVAIDRKMNNCCFHGVCI